MTQLPIKKRLEGFPMEPLETSVQTRSETLPEQTKKTAPVHKVLLCLLAAAFVFYGACCCLAHTSTTFFPRTYINGINVSGMTPEDAAQTVKTQILARDLQFFTAEDGLPIVSVPFASLLKSTPIDPVAVTTAYDTQHNRLFSGGWQYLCHLFSANDTFLPFQWDAVSVDTYAAQIAQQLFRVPQDTDAHIENGRLLVTLARDGRKADPAALRAALTEDISLTNAAADARLGVDTVCLPAKAMTAQEISDRFRGEVQNASYDAKTETIIPAHPHAEFDITAAQAALDAAAPGETIALNATVQEPVLTAAELEKVLFRDVLGEAVTHVSGSAGRIGNVQLSAQTINGLVLNSGDLFSYNETLGQRTAAKGYQPAPAYVRGETVDEIGGGICQTSSTLYLACLRGDLEITERYAHRFIPAYIAAGMDATVSWGGPDYKFTNNTLYPIKIVTKYENNYLTVQLLGTNADGGTVKMSNQQLSTTDFQVVYEESPTQAPGTQTVKVTPYTGSRWRTYRHRYDADGKWLSSDYEATSDYKSRNQVILVAPGEIPIQPTEQPDTAAGDTAADPPVLSGTVPQPEAVA